MGALILGEMAACACGASTASAGICSAIVPNSGCSACTATSGVGVPSLLLQPVKSTLTASTAAARSERPDLDQYVLIFTTSPSASADSPGPSHTALHHPRAHSLPRSVRSAHRPLPAR